MSVNHPSLFIVHGNKHQKVLDRIKTFVSELGITPIIAEEQPSMALPPEEKVEYFMNLCDAILVLATPDDVIVQKGKPSKRKQPRQNVIFEIPMAKRIKPGKIIYMKERTTEFPSDLVPPTYISFRLSRLDDALIHLIRELKGLGLLKIEVEDKQMEIGKDLSTRLSSAGWLTVKVDRMNYRTGDIILVSGKVPAVIEGVPIAIQVFNPRNTMYIIGQPTPAADGIYSFEFKVGGKLGINGMYTVKATYAGLTAQATFEIAYGGGS